ncbi:WD domain repeat-containing protein 55 [Tritrichomonas musculus]|uniref:WD domain repeat-containing protein 55 n=1 Tax=Tritrichomonas musculus TaxID=1915356 RepID=A0ABR2IYD5_9EUKA
MDPIFSYEHTKQFFSGSIAPNLDVWAAGTIEGDIFLFKKGEEKPNNLRFSTGSVRSIEFDHTGENFITADNLGNIFVANLNSLEKPTQIRHAHHESIECMRFLTESVIVVGDYGGHIKIWDLRTQKAVQTYRPDQDYISDIVTINDTNFVTTNGIGSCSVFNSNMNKRKQYYVQEDDDFTTVTYSKYLNFIVIGSSRPKIYVTKYPSLDFVCESPGNSKSPIVFIRSIDSAQNRVAMAQGDGSVCIAEISPNRSVIAFQAHKGDIIGGTLQGTTLMTWGFDQFIKIWDLGEISQTPLVKPKNKKKKGKKVKGMGVKVTGHKDDFFSNY